MNPCLSLIKVHEEYTENKKKIIYILTLHNELYTLYMPL